MRSELRLDIAGICVALGVEDVQLAEHIGLHYGPFLTDQVEPAASIEFEVREGAEFFPEPVPVVST